MNSQQIICFLTVADQLNFSKAAEKLYLSVPTVSHHIKSLEQELNVQLFYRDRHSVLLTEAGHQFYDDASAIHALYENAVASLDKTGDTSLLRLGCTSHYEHLHLSRLFHEMHKKHPELQPDIITDHYARLLDMVRKEEISFMFGSSYIVKNNEQYRFRKLKDMPTFVILSSFDPLHTKEKITAEDLNTTALVYLDEKMVPYQSDNKVKMFLQDHHRSHRDTRCQDEMTACTLCASGMGPILLPEYRQHKDLLDALHLYRRPFVDDEPFSYGLIHRKNLQDRNALQLIRMIDDASVR